MLRTCPVLPRLAQPKPCDYPARVSPLVRATVAIAVLSALSSAVHQKLRPRTIERGAAVSPNGEAAPARPCPPGFLPDNRACIPVPERRDESGRRGAGAWQVYDRLPRRPDRPTEYARYLLPLEAVDLVQESSLGSSGDGVLLMGEDGSAVVSRVLEGQLGPTTVAFAGKLVGSTVVTKHRVREGSREHDYLVVHGNLARIDTKAGRILEPGTKLGSIGSLASGHTVALHLEVRRVRHGFDTDGLAPRSYLDRAHTIAADPRNVFGVRKGSSK